MTDAVLVAARELATEAFTDLRAVVDGLDAAALDWKPAGPDSNSIAILVTHSMHSTRLWLHVAMGLPLPKRDRDAEFFASVSDASELLSLIDDLSRDSLAALDSADTIDPNAPRDWKRTTGEVIQLTVAYALMHAVEHLRGHVDQASLVRHLVRGE